MEEYPNNSRNPKPAPETRGDKRVDKIVTGRVIVKKAPLSKRLAAAFTGDDGRTVMQHVVWDVVIPATKDLLVDAGIEALNRAVYGESRARRTNTTGNPFISSVMGSTLASKISYNNYSKTSTAAAQQQAQPTGSKITRGRVAIEDIILDNRAQADAVIAGLDSLIQQFGEAKIADLFDFVGVTGEYTHEKFGWLSMEGAHARRTPEGYRLDLPAPIQLG